MYSLEPEDFLHLHHLRHELDLVSENIRSCVQECNSLTLSYISPSNKHFLRDPSFFKLVLVVVETVVEVIPVVETVEVAVALLCTLPSVFIVKFLSSLGSSSPSESSSSSFYPMIEISISLIFSETKGMLQVKMSMK